MLTRDSIIEALRCLSDELATRGIIGEINIVGGTAMVLAFSARLATKDVNAAFEPASEIRIAAAQVATRLDLSSDWLNDAAKGFLSANGTFSPIDGLEFSNLRVLALTAEYLLAMKVLASRIGLDGERGDRTDSAFLIRHLCLPTPDAVFEIVLRYYDPARLAPRSIFTVESIMEDMSQ